MSDCLQSAPIILIYVRYIQLGITKNIALFTSVWKIAFVLLWEREYWGSATFDPAVAFKQAFEGFEGSVHKGSHVLCDQFYFSKYNLCCDFDVTARGGSSHTENVLKTCSRRRMLDRTFALLPRPL